MKTRSIRAAIALARDDSRTVERPGPGKAPTAFRIWNAGPNVTDHGTHTLSAASVRAILSTQAARGNLFSIDVDHLSLSPDAPPEARKSVGWMRLASRPDEAGEPELWAVDVEWTDTVRAGLEKDPPEWRYFSPAYDHNKDGEITRYLNTALTNNPATWRVTALATAKESTMTIEELIAELQKLADAGDEKAKKALLSLSETPSETTTAEAPPKEPKMSSEAPPADEKKEPPVAATLATILATVQGLAQKVGGALELDETFSTSAVSAPLVALKALDPGVRSAYKLADGSTRITAELVYGRARGPSTVAVIEETWTARIVGVRKASGAAFVTPRASTVVEPGDQLLIDAESTELQKLRQGLC